MLRAFVCCLALLVVPAYGAVVQITPSDNIRNAISALKPGDELVLGAGTYSLNSRFAVSVVGEADRPIVIRSAPGADVLIHMTTRSQNIMEVQNSQHLVLRGLKLTGGSHGIRLMSSSYITIEDCEIYDTGDVAISANSGGTYENLIIRRNHIHHTNGTGEGMYLGCNNDACRILNSVIEWNYIHHTNGPTVSQGDGIEIKEGSAGNVIRHNVIHDTNYPGILTYSARGNGGPNVIEGNVIWNTGDYAIQSAADAIIRNNILLGEGIGLQSHQSGSPSNQTIVHNTIVTNGAGIQVRSVSGPVVIANNAIYSRTSSAIALISGNLGLVTVAGNVGMGGLSGGSSGFTTGKGIGSDFVNGHFNGTPPIDLFPKAGSALIGAGVAAYATEFDFNGKPRAGTVDAGAYKFESGGNPGWTIAPAFKVGSDVVRPNPPTNVRTQ
jgi:hypothetical protein